MPAPGAAIRWPPYQNEIRGVGISALPRQKHRVDILITGMALPRPKGNRRRAIPTTHHRGITELGVGLIREPLQHGIPFRFPVDKVSGRRTMFHDASQPRPAMTTSQQWAPRRDGQRGGWRATALKATTAWDAPEQSPCQGGTCVDKTR